ncbi:hypothetical protein FHR83_003752 [Actinoplanes campanulatus]|uniref:Lipoprotein n=1 Tax=Actinoplanes campanulatus TaxID=113559 RepID=A0A7W5AH95_9ACTN|nr:hypothetical protein [Actinoplanes campanulatus]MBB3096082.1 hypothetical protein [Actinoplanes campanulatus]GGN13560.1 hypothetical protein GCM10010109_24660 [Actinoplanes campanulatus]GID36824.1 hypothetical protein Aca09nite_33300 [Actinoplanes campanulatus]
MRSTLAVLALGACLLTAACGETAEPVLVSPGTSEIAVAAPATSEPASSSKPVTSKSRKASASPSASKRSPSPKPTTADPKSDPNAACDATGKAEDRLYEVAAANGPLAVGDDAAPAEVTAAVAALRSGYQANVQAVTKARGLTTDKDVRAALADQIAARKAVIALLDKAGADGEKKNAALYTAADAKASMNLWRYPEGLCLPYVD